MDKVSFKSFKLSNELLNAIDLLGYRTPTKVQQKVIPEVLDGHDVIVKSQTGSGKTAAYAIPVCDMADWNEDRPQALVLTPTRELAMQVKEDFFNIGRFKRIKVTALFGKAPFYNQKNELKHKTHIVVGTPGRVMDHIEKGTFITDNIKYLIIDEADEMLNMGFIEQVESIISKIPDKRLTMLFSATLPEDILRLCEKYIINPVKIEIESENVTVDKIIQERYDIEEENKIELLKDIAVVENPDSCIIFCNTKIMVDKVFNELRKNKYSVKKLHGGMEQSDRTRVMKDFKQGGFRYLVSTDVAARGIDIDNISLVINYDIPDDKESYVHRIGRTGRASRTGKAVSFVTAGDKRYLSDIEEYIERDIPLKERPGKEEVESSRQDFLEKLKTLPEIKEAKSAKLNEGIMKLHINAGKKTKMRPVDVVGTLCNIEGMTPEDIGVINILDISTYVEILNGKGEMVLKQLAKKPIKGRIRKVSKAEPLLYN